MSDAAETTAAAVIVALLVLTATAMASIRVASTYERIVVRRFGRVVRVRGPGLVLTIPGLERTAIASTLSIRLHALLVHAVTKDGFRVRVWVEGSCQVTEPGRATEQGGDPRVLAADIVEIAVRRYLSAVELPDLVAARSTPAGIAPGLRTDELAADSGLRILEIHAEEIELSLTPNLLQTLDARG